MPYEVIWSDRAKDDLKGLDRKNQESIVARVESIKKTPFSFIKRLSGVELFSLRVGSYRVIMDVKSSRLIIFVVSVGHIRRVYGKL